jgi:predicted RNA-binding Zn-ribbon protein involved in translation (DUF1610 family)
MSLSNSITLTCPACGHQQAFTVWQSINATHDPGLKESLLDRSLVTFHCEQCGHTAGVNQGLLYHDMDRQVMIMLGCQSPDELEAPEPLVQEFQAQYSLRLVRSMNELIEKVLVLDADLDDRAVEIFKSALMTKIEESQRGDDPQLFFSRIYMDERSREQIEFALVNEAGTSCVSVPLEQSYQRFVDDACRHLPTVISECGQWLRVDRTYVLDYLRAQSGLTGPDPAVPPCDGR